MSNNPTKIVLVKGDGIGPEVADATIEIIKAAGVNLDIEEFLVGESAFDAGFTNGIQDGALEAVKECGIMLKAPLNTPSGGGFTSLNVTMRRELDLWANVRPAVSYPQIDSPRGDVNTTLFRENSEGMYVGLTKDVDILEDMPHMRSLFGGFTIRDLDLKNKGDFSIGLQVISDKGASKIIRAAFDFARANGSAEVHAMSKPNILKSTDGRFKNNYLKLMPDYEDVVSRFSIADAGFGQSAAYPQDRGVIVTQNLYGDFLSDVMAFQAHGSLGLAPSVNIGGDQENPVAMFEAVHGTAPDIAGQGKANPTAFLLSALMMLKFTGHEAEAQTIHDALMKTWEDGRATGDIKLKKAGKKQGLFERVANAIADKPTQNPPIIERGTMNTQEFTKAVIGNLGQKPKGDYKPCYLEDNYRALLPAAAP